MPYRKEHAMLKTFIFSTFGYLAGSLLFARYFSDFFCGKDVTADTPDKNPGTYNAYTYGGFWCGALTLICDLLKGFLPVFLFIRFSGKGLGLVLVMVAPVLGHLFPIWHKFSGGKGIAVSFGVLLGIAPDFRPYTRDNLPDVFVPFQSKSAFLQAYPHLLGGYARDYPCQTRRHGGAWLRCGILGSAS